MKQDRASRRKGATASVATVADASRAGDDNLACLIPRSQIDEIAAAEGIDVGATPEEEWAGRDGPRLWELRAAIKALAEQRGWSEFTRGKYLDRAIKAATTGALVTRDPSLDGSPINGDRHAAIAGGCYLFAQDLNAWLRDVEKVPHVTLREEASPFSSRPPQAQPMQEEAILRKLIELGYEPGALPKGKSGRAGVKAEVRVAIGMCALFQSTVVFDKAWGRLRSSKRIADA